MFLSTSSSSTEKKRPSKFPQSFWVANSMEIFERLAWYGFFAVSSLYITGSRADGALGFTSEQRGTLQGIVPFVLYLLPVLFGALGDRFGYKKTFVIAYSTMVPAYYLLGQFTTFGGFFIAFLFVAVGAAIFKPVVVGTVARTTDESNSSMGFGIFYMMVNIGGFIGPVVAGIVRVKYGWNFVFLASSFWIACNFIWLFLFYKEPTSEAASAQKRTIGQVLSGLVEVLGNGRFFILVFGMLLMIMLGGKAFPWPMVGISIVIWLVLNLLVDIPLRAREKRGSHASGFTAPMKLGNWKFGLYLLILSGFWTSFNQIFITHPEFIRDFVETKDMVVTAEKLFGKDFARGLAAVNDTLVCEQLGQFINTQTSTLDARAKAIQDGGYVFAFDTISGNERAATIAPKTLKYAAQDTIIKELRRTLFDFKVRVPEDVLASSLATFTMQPIPLDPARGHDFLTAFRTCAARDTNTEHVVDSLLAKQIEGIFPGELQGKPERIRSRLISDETLTKFTTLLKQPTLDDRKTAYLLTGIVVGKPTELMTQSNAFAEAYRQVNPEYIINIDAGAIVIFQVLVSWIIGFFAPLSAMIVGIIISAVGIGMAAWTYTGWLVTLAITIFAVGEMIASPKSQEYVGRIAPKQKVAMYMGYYFWTVALGNIFGGVLSGQLYGSLARDAQRPDIMWLIFGGLGLLTAVVLILYNKYVLRGGEME